MHESLKVYLKDSFVGWLSHETVGDEYSFEYDKDYLAHPVDGALSFALPLSAEKFDSSRTFNFFANLLPPRVVRQRLGASLHLSQHNVFGFLKAIGGRVGHKEHKDFVRTIISFHHFPALLRTIFW